MCSDAHCNDNRRGVPHNSVLWVSFWSMDKEERNRKWKRKVTKDAHDMKIKKHQNLRNPIKKKNSRNKE